MNHTDPSSFGVGDVADAKLGAIAGLIRRRFGCPGTILVVGCGDGVEAAILAELLGAQVVGIDIVDAFDREAGDRVELQVADATDLPMERDSFDLVFSFHVLEHVPSPSRAVAEMRRVVRPGGGVWIGTPNRSRLIAYIGSRDASAREKFSWNIIDWKARLSGRFRNDLGAHAGFTRHELANMLRTSFNIVEEETSAYYASLYPGHRRALALVDRSGLGRVVYPALYFAGRP